MLKSVAIGLMFMSLAAQCLGDLQVGFYEGKCCGHNVEDIVQRVIRARFAKDKSVTAALLRISFHDCFVEGCDASILLDGKNSEKFAPQSANMRGFDIIDAVKAEVEKYCPGVVSCADIIAIATRDAVALSGGGLYNVETGRRDGLVSLAENAKNVPFPNISVPDSLAAFAEKGLNMTDMVYLIGAHTVGVTHCSQFKDRLYNFNNTGKPDPTMDVHLLTELRKTCPKHSKFDGTAHLDQSISSIFKVDNSFHQQIRLHRGVLQIDQELAFHPLTEDEVKEVSEEDDFNFDFGAALIKMGRADVKTGEDGEIRTYCRAINKPPKAIEVLSMAE